MIKSNVTSTILKRDIILFKVHQFIDVTGFLFNIRQILGIMLLQSNSLNHFVSKRVIEKKICVLPNILL